MLTVQPGPRDRRLLSVLLILGVVAAVFYIVSQLTSLFFYFGDIFLTFFLAWLLAFIISPIVTRIVDVIPRLPRAVATKQNCASCSHGESALPCSSRMPITLPNAATRAARC